MNRKLFLFDVDGTLTKSRERITDEMLDVLKELKKIKSIDVGFVGGSDLKKQIEQLGEENFHLFDWRFSENGVLAFKGNEQINNLSFKHFMGEKHFMKFINIVLKNLSKIEIPKKRGTFIEYRQGMINVSPIGRACSKDERNEFEEYDKENHVRIKLIESIKKDWSNYCYYDEDNFDGLDLLNFSIGGQISFDVFPKGWDKTYCLQFLTEYDEIHFFGDKTQEGGNDYEIYNDSRVFGHSVTSYQDTINLLNNLVFDRIEEEKEYILVTGGLGFIGSHTCVELLNNKENIIVIDNLSNSSLDIIDKIKEITNCNKKSFLFKEIDIRDKNSLDDLFKYFAGKITSCIHFAGLKAVCESVSNPMLYYNNNIVGTYNLLEVLNNYDCKQIIFSSSATVYGNPLKLPITENEPCKILNPYGRTKLMIENIFQDLVLSDDKTWKIIILRYFNPIGAHPSGIIGENPKGIPNNIMPFISDVCKKKREELCIFGNDYNTPDGTGVRDYIHVVDLSLGHLAALKKIRSMEKSESCCVPINLGTGVGTSVLELVNSMKRASKQEIPHRFVERRSGDAESCYCDPSFAEEYLNWKTKYNIDNMCEDTWLHISKYV